MLTQKFTIFPPSFANSAKLQSHFNHVHHKLLHANPTLLHADCIKTQLVMLQVLNVSGSNITGALPLSWGITGALPALVELDLSHNSINGTLPTAWSASNSLPQLRSLELTDNLLEGGLPSSWGSQSQSFPSLEVLDVALNNLTGTLPAAWCGAGFPVRFA